MGHVMADQGRVILVDCHGRIIQCREHVGPDVDDPGGILPHTVHDVANMLLVQLQEPALDNRRRDFLATDSDRGPFGTSDIDHKLHITVYQLIVIEIFLEQQVITDIFFYQLSV